MLYRLIQMLVESGITVLTVVLLLTIPRDPDDGCFLEALLQSKTSCQLVPVQSGKADIEQHHVWLMDASLFNRGHSVISRLHLVAGERQEARHRACEIRVVIHDEDTSARLL